MLRGGHSKFSGPYIGMITMAFAMPGCQLVPEAEPPPAVELPWPAEPPPLPECVPFEFGFAAPMLSPATGDIRIEFDRLVVPVDAAVAVVVSVLDDNGNIDTAANQTIDLAISGATVPEPLLAIHGVARALVRFSQPGMTLAQATYGARSGSREVYAYRSQLELWELDIDPAGLAEMVENPEEEIWVESTMTVDGTPYVGKTRLRGGTSRDFDKKSFRFNVKGEGTSWGQKRLNLRAEYADKTMARSWLGGDLFRSASWLATPNATPVHFRINGEYYGFMMQIEQIDSYFLNKRGLSPLGWLYESDPKPREVANLTSLPTLDDYSARYDSPAEDYAALQTLIDGLLEQPQSVFSERAAQEIDIDSVLVYLAVMALIQNQDNILKNFSIYRDTDVPWMVIPWDLDLTFGHLFTEEYDVLDETITTDGTLLPGVDVGLPLPFNGLHDAILRDENRSTRYYDILEHLVETRFDPDLIAARLDNFHCRTAPEVFFDQRKRASNEEYLGRLGEIIDFVAARRQFIRSKLATRH